MMNGGPISWKSRRQDNVSLSTSEAEFVAASEAGQEAIYLRETLTDFGFSQTQAILLYEENFACVAMSKNPVRRKFSRHIDIRMYFVRELVLAGFLKLVPLRTHKMVADALTKSLPSPAFIGHSQIMTGHTPFAARLLRCVGGYYLIACGFCPGVFVYMILFPHISFFFMFTHRYFLLCLPIVYFLKIPRFCMGESDKAPMNKICRRSSLA